MKILILGGLGFLGKHVKKELQADHEVTTFSRSIEPGKHISGSILNLQEITEAAAGFDVLINLVGLSPIKKPSKGLSYEDVHVNGVRNIIEASEKSNIRRIIHLSALGSDSTNNIDYFRTKGVGEDLIKSSNVNYNIIRPSVLDGEGNEFQELMHKFSKFKILVFPKFTTKVQPIHADFVARTIKIAVQGRLRKDITELGGKETLTIYEFAKQAATNEGIHTIPIPASFAKLAMKVALRTHLFDFSDQILDIMEFDNITSANKK